MPYLIAVLSFVVIGVGFTLFNTQNQSLTAEDTSTIEIQETPEPTENELADIDSSFKENFEKLLDSAIESATKTIAVEMDEIKPLAPKPVESTPVQPPVQNTLITKTEPVAEPTPKPVIVTDYQNGTYAKQVSYRTPDGTYKMDVSVTVSNDTVTNAAVSFDKNGSRDSYSKRFLKSYSSQVIGSDMSTVNLSRVGGASLTTDAFNNAISAIKNQAKT